MNDIMLVLVLGAAAAGFAQGVSGFAFSLIALSVWSWGVEPQLAAPMAVFGSLLGQLVALPWVWRGFDARKLVPLLGGGLLGVPLGVIILPWIDPVLFKLLLGLFLVVYCPVLLWLSPNVRWTRWGRIADAAAGFIGGVFGGIAGISGPVPTLWTTLRGWNKDTQRGVLQAFNIAMHVSSFGLYAVSGRITLEVVMMIGTITPAVIVSAAVGVLIFGRLNASQFRRVILSMLFVAGLGMVSAAVNAPVAA